MDVERLTDEEIERVGQQIAARRRLEANRVPDPIPPSPDSWEGQFAAAQERKRQERVAAVKAKEEQQIADREREAREAQERFEATAEQRAPIEAELDQINMERAQLDRRKAELYERERELRADRERLLAPPAEGDAEDGGRGTTGAYLSAGFGRR